MSSHMELKETATLSLSPHLYPIVSMSNSSIMSTSTLCNSSASSRSPSPCKKISNSSSSSSLSSNIDNYVKISVPVSYNDECNNIRKIDEILYKKDLRDSSHQIAGHCKEKGYKNFLVSKQLGRMYKPILLKKSKKEAENYTFEKEIYFYERKLPLVPEMTLFIPRYFGIQYIVDEEGLSKYLALEDLTNPFEIPSIMDVKLGTQSYVDTASEEKKLYEISKFPHQSTLGFRISGIKTFRHNEGYIQFDRKWTHACEPGNQMINSFKEYFFDGSSLRKDVIQLFLVKLQELLAIFQKQNKLRFIASSLLFLYESKEGSSPRIDFRLIDFAHTHNSNGQRDEGSITGLTNIIHYLQQLLLVE